MTRAGKPLTPAEQLRVLSRIWRVNRDGYVFMPWISGGSATKAQRRKNYHEGRAFEWPREKAAILEHVRAHQEDDLYFCPNLFNGKRRQEELVYAETCLYADLDAVDPRKVRSDRRPTVAWESSPGRFQAIWLLGAMREGATWPGGENQRLTYELGADLSGWDATQLLRVPGKPNYKFEYKEQNSGDPVPGRLLWDNGPRYGWDDFDDLPEVGVVAGDQYELMDEELLAGIDRHEVWARVRMRCSARVRRHLAAKSADDADGADRSDVLWEICRDLADAGCNLAEIVAVTRQTIWNKYVGRNDELRRLKTEASKAIEESGGGTGALEVADEKPRSHTTVDDLFAEDVRRPRWLVKDIWPEGGCGFIAGAPKSYKSWIALDLAVALASGKLFLGRFPVVGGPKRVLVLQQEDSKTLVRERFQVVVDGTSPGHNRGGLLRATRSGVDWYPPLPMPLYLEVRSGFVASDEGWQSWLDEYIAQERIDAAVVDTLFTSAGNIDLDKSQDLMTRMLAPLRAISEKHNCAVAIVHHNKKDAYGNGKDGDADVTGHLSSRAGKDMLGTVAMHAWVDTALYVRARRDADKLPGVMAEVRTMTTAGGRGGQEVTGEKQYLGVPGVEVYVERESKLAEEIRFRLGIPRMSRRLSDDGEGGAWTERWTPIVRDGWRSEEEGESTNARGGRAMNGNGRASGGRNGKRPAGALVAEKLREMGVTATRGKTLSDICDVVDQTKRTVQRQLTAAQEAGLVRAEGERWYVIAEESGR